MIKPLFFGRLSLLFYLLCGLAFASSCSKKESEPAASELLINFGPGLGYSPRDANNRPTGNPDPTDWTLDGKWNAKEADLFKSLAINVNDKPIGTASVVGAYPNPATTSTKFSWSTPDATLCNIVVVDQSYQSIIGNSSSTPSLGGSSSFDLTRSSAFKKGQLFRIYYVMYNGATLYCKGHGDIKIAE